MGGIFQHVSAAGAERIAREWYESQDPNEKVGTRHHIVPRSLLKRFASTAGQVRVRDRFTGRLRLVSIGDLAVRDFYTFIDLHGHANGTMEVWLSEVEQEFARVIQKVLEPNAFTRPRGLTEAERFAVDTFVGVQALRGMRTRRSMEIIADYGVKLVNQESLTSEEIRDLEIVPHQNEHIQFVQRASEQVADLLSVRPLSIDINTIEPSPSHTDRGATVKQTRVDGGQLVAYTGLPLGLVQVIGFVRA